MAFALADSIKTVIGRAGANDPARTAVQPIAVAINTSIRSAAREYSNARIWRAIDAAVPLDASTTTNKFAWPTNALPVYALFPVKARISTCATMLWVVLQVPALALAFGLIGRAQTLAAPTAFSVCAALAAITAMVLVRLQIPASILFTALLVAIAGLGSHAEAAIPFAALSTADEPALATRAVAVDTGFPIVAGLATRSAVLRVDIAIPAANLRTAMFSGAERHPAVTAAAIACYAHATANNLTCSTRAVAVVARFAVVAAIAASTAIHAVGLVIHAFLAAFVRPGAAAPLLLVLLPFSLRV